MMYQSAPFFFLRHSLVSIEDLKQIISSTDRKQSLFNYYKNNPSFRLSIAIASPSLHASLKNDLKKGFFTNHQHYLSMLKYLLRASTRTTPFGLFAAVGFGKFEQQVSLFKHDQIVKKIRPDMSWVSETMKRVFHEIKETKNFQLMTNPSILLKGNKFYLFEQFSNTTSTELITIIASKYSKHILKLCSHPIHCNTLIHKLVEVYGDVHIKEIQKSLSELLEKGFLLSELTPNLTKHDIFKDLLLKTETFSQKSELINQLQSYSSLFNSFEHADEQQSLSILEEIYTALENPETLPYPVQVDCARKETITLPKKIATQAALIPQILLSLQCLERQNENLQQFHREFLESFGVDVLVPLKHAMQRIKYTPSEYKTHQKTPLDSLIMNSVSNQVIEVSDQDLQKFTSQLDKQKLPFSCEVFFEILSSSPEEIEKGNYHLLLNPHLATSQAGCSLGRFLYLFDNSVQEDLKQFLFEEEQIDPETIIIEASFLPTSSRTANVAIFKPIRKYHLRFGYQENSAEALNIEDIYLGANLDHIYIFSKKLNRKLHVTFSTAINENLAPPPLKLLLDISKHRFLELIPYPLFSKSKEAFLPELRYKNIILSPKRWLIQKEEFYDPSIPQKKQKEALRTIFMKKKIPSQILLCLYDHRLKLNWELDEHFDIIYQQMCSKEEIILFESLHENYGSPFKFGQNHYHAELSVSCILKSPTYTQQTPQKPLNEYFLKEPRILSFGSNCLYSKIYLPQDQEEEFIKTIIPSFIHQLTETGFLDYWFFIRYHDTNPHIRLRIFSKNVNKLFDIFSQETNRWLQKEIIQEISIHSYERELERYGGIHCIESVEQFFCIDSILTVQSLQHIHKQNHYPLFFIASINILLLLHAFFKKIEDCIDFLNAAKIEKTFLSGIRSFYKPLINYVTTILFSNTTPIKDSFLEELSPLFKSYSHYALELHQEIQDKNLSKLKTWKLLDSLIHMHCNRLMGIDHELEKKARCFSEFLARKIAYTKEYTCM